MSDSDDFLPLKRGRPKKSSNLNKRKSKAISYSSSLVMSRHLSNLQKIYTKENYNQKLINMITRVPHVVNLPIHILQLQLQIFLEESAKQLMLTELELVGFTIVLEKLLLKNLNMPGEELLKICLFISKNVFESNEETLLTIKSSLKCQFKNFETNLMILSQGISFTISDINKRYKDIEKSMHSSINYTYYVDSIIRQSPPYKTSDKNYGNPDKYLLKAEEGKMGLKNFDESKKLHHITEEAFNDQQSALEYYNLMPIEDDKFLINPDNTLADKFMGHRLEFLDYEIPILDDEDDIGTLLSFS